MDLSFLDYRQRYALIYNVHYSFFLYSLNTYFIFEIPFSIFLLFSFLFCFLTVPLNLFFYPAFWLLVLLNMFITYFVFSDFSFVNVIFVLYCYSFLFYLSLSLSITGIFLYRSTSGFSVYFLSSFLSLPSLPPYICFCVSSFHC